MYLRTTEQHFGVDFDPECAAVAWRTRHVGWVLTRFSAQKIEGSRVPRATGTSLKSWNLSCSSCILELWERSSPDGKRGAARAPVEARNLAENVPGQDGQPRETRSEVQEEPAREPRSEATEQSHAGM